MQKRIALFPGSFDPFTKGHEDIVLRARLLFDEVVIGIGQNSQKQRYVPIEQMIGYISQTFEAYNNVRIETFKGLTAVFAETIGASYLLRGLRNTTDFEYENSIAQINRNVNKNLDTVFLITAPELAYISSSIVRDIHKYGKSVSEYLPYELPPPTE
jgi:pantetheine-phosphate adenylyltransferase